MPYLSLYMSFGVDEVSIKHHEPSTRTLRSGRPCEQRQFSLGVFGLSEQVYNILLNDESLVLLLKDVVKCWSDPATILADDAQALKLIKSMRPCEYSFEPDTDDSLQVDLDAPDHAHDRLLPKPLFASQFFISYVGTKAATMC